jgi:sarcosine oxidase subunit beta
MADEGGPQKDRDVDAVIIGAGVIGSAIALELARRGWRTLSLDKLPTPGYGSTSASSAIIRFSYSTASGVAMAYEGLRYWKDWRRYIGDIGEQPLAEYVNQPMLLPKTPGGHHEKVVPLFDQLGVRYEDLDAVETVRRFPSIDLRIFGPPARLDDVDHPFWGEPDAMHDGVIVMPEAGYISDPQLSAQNLAAAAANAGAEFRFNTAVTSIDRADGRVGGVTTSNGDHISCPVVVNVAGPHARIVNGMAGVLAAMNRSSRALRREVYIVPAPPDSDFDRTGFSMGDGDTGVYFRGERGNNILIGNAEPECDELEWVADPDSIDDTLSENGFELHALRTARRVKGTPIPLQKSGLVSMYDATPDWTPIYDRSDLDGFYLACGTSGNQFKNAPIAGHVMAELITAIEAGHDHDGDPLVVTGPYTGLPIDMGTFTRNRVVPDDTHMNVFG